MSGVDKEQVINATVESLKAAWNDPENNYIVIFAKTDEIKKSYFYGKIEINEFVEDVAYELARRLGRVEINVKERD